MTKANKREIRNAKRRTRFTWIDDGIAIYEKPCGCVGREHYVPDGIRVYQYSSHPLAARGDDLVECLMCGAVWTMDDIEIIKEKALKEIFEGMTNGSQVESEHGTGTDSSCF